MLSEKFGREVAIGGVWEACKQCAVREHCTAGEGRTISRDARGPLLEVLKAMREKLRSEEGKHIYEKRAYTVAPIFRKLVKEKACKRRVVCIK